MPCSPGDPGAEYYPRGSYLKLGADVMLPPVNMGDYLMAIRKSPKSSNEGDMAKFTEWTKENGMMGA